MKTRKHDPIAMALGLALAILPATAQVDPESICAKRADTLFKSGSEALDQVKPIGLQDCSSLENFFDDDLEDANPLVVPLAPDEARDFATLRTLADESTRGAYTAVALDEVGNQVALPDFCSFDSEFGVTSCEAPAGTTGEFLVEYSVVPQEGFPGSVNPLFVLYDFGGVSDLSVEGLGVLESDEVTITGKWDYSITGGNVNDDVSVRADQLISYGVHVLTNKNDTFVTIEDCINCYDASANGPMTEVPSYVSTTGNRIDYNPGAEAEGDSGILELKVCDVNMPTNCEHIFSEFNITSPYAQLAGLGDSPYGVVTNPNQGGGLRDIVESSCVTGSTDHIILEELYKGDQFVEFILPDNVSVDSNDGAINADFDCNTQTPGTQYGAAVGYGSTSMGVIFEVTADGAQQSSMYKGPHFR